MKQTPVTLELKPAAALALLAGASGVLVVLTAWGFQMRSVARFSLLAGAASLTAGLLLWLLARSRLHSIPFDRSVLWLSLGAGILAGAHLALLNNSGWRMTAVFLLTAGSLSVLNLAWAMWAKTLPLARRDWFFGAALLVGLAGLAIILYNALSVRIYGDDFANVLKLERLGVWQASLQFYETWSPRFASNFLVIGFSDKPWAPLLFLALIQFSLFFSLKSILLPQSRSRWLALTAGAFFLPLAVYSISPDLYKTLYWNGTAMNSLPLMLLIPVYLALLVCLFRQPDYSRAAAGAAGALLSFLITSTHESAGLAWALLESALALWFFTSKSANRPLRAFLLASLAATIGGLLVMIGSPGAFNRIQAQEYSQSRQLLGSLWGAFRDFLAYLRDFPRPLYVFQYPARPAWLMLASLGLLGYATPSPLPRRLKCSFWLLGLSALMAVAAFFPGPYILSGPIPPRTQFIPTLFLTFGVYASALSLPRPGSSVTRAVGLILGLQILLMAGALTITQLSRTLAPMRQYARDWDERDARVRATGELPRRLQPPWEEYEQNLGDFRKYYRSRPD